MIEAALEKARAAKSACDEAVKATPLEEERRAPRRRPPSQGEAKLERQPTSCSEASTAAPSARGDDDGAASICSFRSRLPSRRRGASPAVQAGQESFDERGSIAACAQAGHDGPARRPRQPEGPAPTCRAPTSMKALKADEEALSRSLMRLDFKEMLRQFEGKPALWQDAAPQNLSEECAEMSASQNEAKLQASLERLGDLLAGLQDKAEDREAAAKRRQSHLEPQPEGPGQRSRGRGRPPILAAGPPAPRQPPAQQERCPPSRARSASEGRGNELAAADKRDGYRDSQAQPEARAVARLARSSSARGSRGRSVGTAIDGAAESCLPHEAADQQADQQLQSRAPSALSQCSQASHQSSRPSSVLRSAAGKQHGGRPAAAMVRRQPSGIDLAARPPSVLSTVSQLSSRPASVLSCDTRRDHVGVPSRLAGPCR